MNRLTLQGAALFAFIPLVLILYVQRPLGAGISLAVGFALMIGHRFVAGPWMRTHAKERCLWCGHALSDGMTIDVNAGGGRCGLAACHEGHREKAARFMTFVFKFRFLIGPGIFLPLLVLLAGTLADALGYPFISHEANVFQFRTIVATTVVGTSLGYLAIKQPAETLTSPFPIHNLFLLGIRNTLWVFRIVGAWWLLPAIRVIAQSLG